jgi:DNA-binding CsgD family transcriptional regulator
MEESEAEHLHTAFHSILADYKQVPEAGRDNYHIYLNNVLQKGKKRYMLFNKLSVLSHSMDGQPDVLWGVAKVGKASYLLSIMAGAPGTEHFRNYSFTNNTEAGVAFVELTDGERTMLSLAQCGYSVAEIAQAMNRTEDTVKFYRRQIFHKFGVDTISEAVAYAENNYFSSGERHRYFKLKECKDTDGLGLFGGKCRRGSFDVFTESILGLIRSVIGHG